MLSVRLRLRWAPSELRLMVLPFVESFRGRANGWKMMNLKMDADQYPTYETDDHHLDLKSLPSSKIEKTKKKYENEIRTVVFKTMYSYLMLIQFSSKFSTGSYLIYHLQNQFAAFDMHIRKYPINYQCTHTTHARLDK